MLTKFKELMRKPITWGDLAWLNFWSMIGTLAACAGFYGIEVWKIRKNKKAKKDKKGYTKIKLDDLPDDGEDVEIKEVFSWD